MFEFNPIKSKESTKHINESSEQYQTFLNERKNKPGNEKSAFGKDQIDYIDNIRRRIAIRKSEEDSEENRKSIAQQQEEIIDTLSFLQEKLARKFISESNLTGFFAFLKEMAQDEKISKKFTENISSESGLELIIGTHLIKKTIPAEFFEEMIRAHIDLFERKQEEFQNRLPEIISSFKDKVQTFIQNGHLPITSELLDSRISEMTISLIDSLEGNERVVGNHNSDTGVLGIRTDEFLTKEQQEKVVFHEGIHALSGRTILMDDNKQVMPPNIQHQRIGLVFKTKKTPQKFRWLNEAVTESITMDLKGDSEGEYKDERIALQNLYEKGISKELIYKAYFENYITNGEEHIPAWKNFVCKLDELFPEIGGIRKLEEIEEMIDTKMEEDMQKLRNQL